MTYGTEAVMFRFAWAVALGVAFATGFVANEMVHRRTLNVSHQIDTAVGEDLCDVAPTPLVPPLPLEEIDLTVRQEVAFGPQSMEPPLAGPPDGLIRTVSFEIPAGSPETSELPVMPYLTDDPTPAVLPPLGDVPVLTPMPKAEDPLFKAVKRFFEVGTSADVTDKVPLGQPPVSEHPSAAPPPVKPVPPHRPDTTEVRPSDLPPLPSGIVQ
jgi:hypothetical protein